jgi:REP element-mobilizing transposase RayT
MTRALRNDDQTGSFHVINRGAGRRRVFFVAADAKLFVALMRDGAERFGIEIHAFCLMPNHYHLLVNCPGGRLSSFMQFVAANFTRGLNTRLQSDGPVFRSRFRSLPVNSGTYLDLAGRYIHRNPLDISGAPELSQYRWSSYPYYAGTAPTPGWLRTEVLLDMHADRASYREFVEGDVPIPATPSYVLWAVRTAIAHHASEELSPQGLDRTVLAALWSEADPLLRRSIEPLLADDPAARRKAIGRATRRATDPLIADLVGRVQRLAA